MARLTSPRAIVKAAWIGAIAMIIVAVLNYGPKIKSLLGFSHYDQYWGRVFDALTSQPILDAKVTLDMEGVPLQHSDSEGSFYFQAKEGQIVLLRVEKQGYRIYEKRLSLGALKQLEKIELVPSNKLIGTVVRSDNKKPLSGVEITTDFGTEYTYSDDAGKFILTLQGSRGEVINEVRVKASLSGFMIWERIVSLDRPESFKIEMSKAK